MFVTHDLKDYFPRSIVSGIKGNSYPLKIREAEGHYEVFYESNVSNHTGANVGKRRQSWTFPQKIRLDKKGFEVLGLLQGEMSKTQRGPITFANSEPGLVQHTISWLNDVLGIPSSSWHWYIKLNIPEPTSRFCSELEENLIPMWLFCCDLDYEMRYPKTLSFISSSKREFLKNDGTMIIERRGPIVAQTLQHFVRTITGTILSFPHWAIRSYLRGIIAAESTVNFRLKSGCRRVFITATNESERTIFHKCLHKLGIETKDCKPIKDIVISRKENIAKLHNLGLMTLNPTKHERFLWMIFSYETFPSRVPSKAL